MAQEPNPINGQAVLAQGQRQIARGLVETFLRDERAPIHSHALLGLQIQHELHGIGRVDVHILHEIARELGANEQGQKIDCANAFANAD